MFERYSEINTKDIELDYPKNIPMAQCCGLCVKEASFSTSQVDITDNGHGTS